jgi:hypothetical protein
MKQQTEDRTNDIRMLARAVNEHVSEDLLQKLHIGTPVEQELLDHTTSGRVVIVTGNPGDGKTHLIRRVQDRLPRKTVVVTDANLLDSEALITTLRDALTKKVPLVMAINEGILLQACDDVKDRYGWAAEIVNLLLNPYLYGREASGVPQSAVVIFDLTHRNNLAPESVNRCVTSISKLASGGQSALSENARRMLIPAVGERLGLLLDAVARTGFHATMRDLLGFVAHLICGGEDELENGSPSPYYVNAFEGGDGPLFSAVRSLDPVSVPSPFLDDRLFEDDDTVDEWLVQADEDRKCERDLEEFKRRKRRAFFEHQDGATLLRQRHDAVHGKLQQLRDGGESPERVAIALLNRFFDASDDSSDDLTIWTAHRYHARPVRYLASITAMPADEFEIRVPRLPEGLQRAFPHRYADHVVLAQRDMPTNAGLRIDKPLILQLLEGDRVSGLGVRHPEAYAKVSGFYDRLSRRTRNGSGSVVKILRSDTMQHVSIGINTDKKSYFLPGALA